MTKKNRSSKAPKNQPNQSSKTEKNSSVNSYTAKDIYVLEGLEPVRKRPGMYIGSTGIDGLHHLIFETTDNSLDEAMAGYAKNIEITLLANNRVRVKDDGRGIPVEKHKQTGKSALETVMTTLHAGSKFGGESYKIAGGLHGVGVSVVNALSSYLKVEVCRQGALYEQEYIRGKPKKPVKKVGECDQDGTIVTFEPDPEIFKDPDFDWTRILNHLRQQAYLTKGIRITINDYRSEIKTELEQKKENNVVYPSYVFYFEGGIISYVNFLNHRHSPNHENIFYVAKERDSILTEVAFQYTDNLQGHELSFANNIYTIDGGMHLTGFRSAITRTFNDYARKNGYLKEKDENLSGEDIREGLTSVISVKLREPQFEGQTKAKLGTPEARTAVETVVAEELADWLERNPNDGRQIMGKVVLAARARIAAKAARETVIRKGALEGFTLPGKLADCSSKNPAESELFIVEGESAGGCFSGDTKVKLADGRNLSFKELVEEDRLGKKNYCYTVNKNGELAMAPILYPRVTRRNTEVIKLILDTGKEIICTPEHKFMLRDGGYKKASELSPDDSLKPLYRKHSKIGGRITHELYFKTGKINPDEYDKFRKESRNKSLLRLGTIAARSFDNDINRLFETTKTWNHKIKRVIWLEEKMDVYDIKVPNTHNFALASGVFVHNSSKQGRDRKTQAILPLRGKILNVEKARIDKMLASQEIRSLIIALGTAIAEEFDLSKLRYHKVIIMSDSDIDGAHIRTLLLTLFYRYFQQLIEKGYVYIAQPPLYKIQVGKVAHYAYNDAEKEKVLNQIKSAKASKELPKKEVAAKEGVWEVTPLTPENQKRNQEMRDGKMEEGAKISGVAIQRYKGLGEMNASELRETTMDPANRILLQVTMKDTEEADKIFDILMGSDVLPRKKFIQTHAKHVKNLDI